MGNISKKNRKKLVKVLNANCHCTKTFNDSIVTFYPYQSSPLSAVWKYLVRRPDGVFIGRFLILPEEPLIPVNARYCLIHCPEQLFNPRAHIEINKQIVQRLRDCSQLYAIEYAGKQTVLKHSIDDINSIIKGAKTSGTLKAAFDNAGVEQGEIDELSHGIDNIDWLFPEDHLLDTTPRIIDKPDDWVSVVMGGVKHIPFSRFKSMFADLTPEDARAKGYVKGNYKIEEVFGLLRRSTGPTTVYKKQKLDRDDVSDITSFDVVSWLRNEMRYKLNRELALAYILGDGRQAASEDKIDENCIRPIFNDADLFTIKVQVATTGLSKVEDKYKAFIKQVIRSRKEYRGSGTPTMFTTEDALTEMLLLEDGMGRPLYVDEAALARKLRVSKIVTVSEMDGRKGAKGGDLAAVIVNLSDYTVGADKGGAVSMFDDFDIDYNAMKYLIETRCSGALTTPYSAMAIEWAA